MEEHEKSVRIEFLGDGVYRVVWVDTFVEEEEEIEYKGPAAPTAAIAKQTALDHINEIIAKIQAHDVELPALRTDEDNEGNEFVTDDGTLDDPFEVVLSIDEDDLTLTIGWYFGTRSDNYDAMYDEAVKKLIEYRTLTEAL